MAGTKPDGNGELLSRTVDDAIEIYDTENDEAWIRSDESVPISWQS
mgnify:CR=1